MKKHDRTAVSFFRNQYGPDPRISTRASGARQAAPTDRIDDSPHDLSQHPRHDGHHGRGFNGRMHPCPRPGRGRALRGEVRQLSHTRGHRAYSGGRTPRTAFPTGHRRDPRGRGDAGGGLETDAGAADPGGGVPDPQELLGGRPARVHPMRRPRLDRSRSDQRVVDGFRREPRRHRLSVVRAGGPERFRRAESLVTVGLRIPGRRQHAHIAHGRRGRRAGGRTLRRSAGPRSGHRLRALELRGRRDDSRRDCGRRGPGGPFHRVVRGRPHQRLRRGPRERVVTVEASGRLARRGIRHRHSGPLRWPTLRPGVLARGPGGGGSPLRVLYLLGGGRGARRRHGRGVVVSPGDPRISGRNGEERDRDDELGAVRGRGLV